MRFIFEVVNKEVKASEDSDYNRLRRMMMAFETMINTVLIEFHVHLRKEE